MSNAQVHSLLRQQFASIPAYEKSYVNIPYTPTQGVVYLRENFLPAQIYPVGLEDTSHDEYSGIYQITIYAPENAGVNASYDAVDTIRTYFYRGLKFDDFIRIEKVYDVPPLIYDTWIATPVRIEYRGFIKD